MEKCRGGVYDTVETFMNNFAAEGYSATQLLYQLHERTTFADDLSAKQKIVIGEKMAVNHQKKLNDFFSFTLCSFFVDMRSPSI